MSFSSFSFRSADISQVRVCLLDLNDNAPRFVLDSYQSVISENSSVDTAILQVSATDADSGLYGKVRYSITRGNWNRTFELDNNGVLRLQQRLRKQGAKFFNLTIVASDNGTPPQTSRPTFVYIKIKRPDGPNETNPVFDLLYSATVNESCPVDTHILHVGPRFGKQSSRGYIQYIMSTIRDPQVDKHFVVEAQSGVVKLIRPLDYETTSRYSFYVRAVGTYQKLEKALFFYAVLC